VFFKKSKQAVIYFIHKTSGYREKLQEWNLSTAEHETKFWGEVEMLARRYFPAGYDIKQREFQWYYEGKTGDKIRVDVLSF